LLGSLRNLCNLLILQRTDDCLGGESVAECIEAGALLSFRGGWASAFERMAAVGLDLPGGGHGVTTPIGLVLRFRLAFDSAGTEVGESLG
jgi:hypothetical protein